MSGATRHRVLDALLAEALAPIEDRERAAAEFATCLILCGCDEYVPDHPWQSWATSCPTRARFIGTPKATARIYGVAA